MKIYSIFPLIFKISNPIRIEIIQIVPWHYLLMIFKKIIELSLQIFGIQFVQGVVQESQTSFDFDIFVNRQIFYNLNIKQKEQQFSSKGNDLNQHKVLQPINQRIEKVQNLQNINQNKKNNRIAELYEAEDLDAKDYGEAL
ncbi:unnamed protein product (macronuclear) [Paramecium tetraurelia]|uniref:Transmembrane protein n=1 Tax=Paramecium tetraurelia TaxID=5888 RepID=A0CIN7_PARTE|nr:uncharacterized protein GSPATT00007789001 [Paramecium tetraurelia]CAK70654.1 unnamed protein product [Paramecium tetraurelia]|eukprot:XP_001438051.1 hypothetical protein (macronuclear) [Paramecium tetraurelia strain d4-2]